MSRIVQIRPVRVQGGKVELLPEVAQEVAAEMQAEGRTGVSFDVSTKSFVSEGKAEVSVGYGMEGGRKARGATRTAGAQRSG